MQWCTSVPEGVPVHHDITVGRVHRCNRAHFCAYHMIINKTYHYCWLYSEGWHTWNFQPAGAQLTLLKKNNVFYYGENREKKEQLEARKENDVWYMSQACHGNIRHTLSSRANRTVVPHSTFNCSIHHILCVKHNTLTTLNSVSIFHSVLLSFVFLQRKGAELSCVSFPLLSERCKREAEMELRCFQSHISQVEADCLAQALEWTKAD